MSYTPVDIVAFIPGTYTPGAETALRNAVNMINAAWNQANIKQDEFSTKMEAIATTWLSTAVAPHITAPTAVAAPAPVEPSVIIPATQDAGAVLTAFDAKYVELVALLADKFTAFRTAYFPNEQADYVVVETWLQNALNNPNAGLPQTVVDQLLDDDRARTLIEANRASDTVMATFAGKRFPLPPLAAANAVLQIQTKALDEISDSSRKITTTSIENIRFAIEKSLSVRQIAMGAAVDYIKAIASAPEIASRVVGVGYDAQSKLISAASSFYGARTEAAKLISSVSEYNSNTALHVSDKNQAADIGMIEARLKALLTEATVLGHEATALFNNIHATAGSSYGVSVS